MSKARSVLGRWAVCVFLGGLSGCGGSSTSPTPTSTPAAAANDFKVTSVSSADPATAGVATAPCTGGSGTCSTGLRIEVTVTFNQATSGAQVYLQFLDSLGRQCASRLSDSLNLQAGTPTLFSITSVAIECSLPFTAASGRVTLFGANPGNAPVTQRAGLFAGNLNLGGTWRFAPPAGAATPTPTPVPTPTPGASCGGTSARISDFNLSAETVTVSGNGSMSGWRIDSRTGSQRFNFPSGFNLSGSVRIQSGPGSCSPSSTLLCWTTANIWNNNGDAASLYDCQGNLVNTISR